MGSPRQWKKRVGIKGNLLTGISREEFNLLVTGFKGIVS
jgi:hypothetical protein